MLIKDYVLDHDVDDNVSISFKVENLGRTFTVIIATTELGTVNWCQIDDQHTIAIDSLVIGWPVEEQVQLREFVSSQIRMVDEYLRDSQEMAWYPVNTSMKNEDVQKLIHSYEEINQSVNRDLSDFSSCFKDGQQYLATYVTMDNLEQIFHRTKYIFPIGNNAAFVYGINSIATVPCYMVFQLDQQNLEAVNIECFSKDDFLQRFKWMEKVK